MKKLLGIMVLGLLLNGCGEPAEKIYPKNGMFPKTKPHYELFCIVDAGPDQVTFELDLIIQEKLNKNEKNWLNNYHKTVFKNLVNSMNKTEALELEKACSAI